VVRLKKCKSLGGHSVLCHRRRVQYPPAALIWIERRGSWHGAECLRQILVSRCLSDPSWAASARATTEQLTQEACARIGIYCTGSSCVVGSVMGSLPTLPMSREYVWQSLSIFLFFLCTLGLDLI
jgi:hypothetical protein